jgi:pimeloyl-ACP methyl ester carboxylesterase
MSGGANTTTGYADVNGARIYYEVAGEGRPLVLLHGGLVDSGLWDPQFPVFAERYRTIRYDLRGYGRSSDAVAPYSHVEDLAALLRHLRIERAHVLGLSMSGTTAIDFTLAYPATVTALVHVGGGVSGYQPENVTEVEERMITAEEAAWERGDIAEAVDVTVRLWTDGPGRTPDQVDPAVRERVREMTMRIYGRGEGTPGTPLDPPAVSRLGEIRAPTLVVHGDKDLAEIAEVADVVVRGIPGARKAVIPDAAHHPNLEKPEEFNRIVLEFLAEVG